MTSENDTAISCRDLIARYGSFTALDRLSLSVRRGECFGLLGPNGAGKTTAMEIFEGLQKPAGGAVSILGGAWGESRKSDRSLREKIGVTLQETHFPDKLCVKETLELFRSFYPEGKDVAWLMDILDLTRKKDAKVGTLSGGQRQRLAVAVALVGKPELLFLDEPTTGLDPGARIRIWNTVEAFVAENNTVILTTHYMEEASRLCHRVGILDEGRLQAEDSPAGLLTLLGAKEIVEVTLGSDPPAGLFASMPQVLQAQKRGGVTMLFTNDSAALTPKLLAALSGAGVGVRLLVTRQATLEDVFLHLTGKKLAQAAEPDGEAGAQ